MVHLLGVDSGSKRAIAKQAADDLRLAHLPAAAPTCCRPAGASSKHSRGCGSARARCCRSLCTSTPQDADRELAARVAGCSRRISGPVFLETRDAWPQLGRDALTIDVAKPTAAEQEQAWRSVLGADAGEHARAHRRAVHPQSSGHPADRPARCGRRAGDPAASVWEALRPRVAPAPRLARAADRARGHGWDDLVLPDDGEVAAAPDR